MITYTSAMQNTIALNVWGRQNSGLTTDDKTHLDGAWTTGSLTAGLAFQALTRLNQIGQWFEQAGASSAPAAWEHWFISLTSLLLAKTHRPDRAALYAAEERQAADAALSSFSLTDATSATISGQTLTVPGLRYYVMNHCVRRRRRLFVPPADIDAHLQWVLNHLWNLAGWNFRKRLVTLTIASNGTVTSTLTNETLDSIATRELWYTDAPGFTLKWATAEEMARLKAEYGTDTGRPLWFRLERSGSSLTWHLAPLPDAQYTLRSEVYISGPATLTDATSLTNALAKFPTEFGPVIRDLVLGRVLEHHGAEDGAAVVSRAMDQVTAFLPAAEDHGRPAHTQEVRDRYGDARAQTGQNAVGGVL